MEKVSFKSLITRNIDYVTKHLIEYIPPFPPSNDEYIVNFEEITTLEHWQSLINDSKNEYKDLIKFVICKKIYNQNFITKKWEFNSKIETDIIQSFQFYLFKNCDSNKTIFDLKHMPYFYYDRNMTHVLESYSENLKQTKLYPILNNLGIELDSEDAHFLNFICSNITEEIIVDYFINGQDMDFLKYSIFYDWYEFSNLNKVMLFILNPKRRRCFSGVLTNKNLSSIEETENFYLMNEIHVPTGYVLINKLMPSDKKFYSPDEFKELKIEAFFDYEISIDRHTNPLLIDDIFNLYKFDYIDYIQGSIHSDTDKIDIEYNLAYDFEEKNKLLRSKLKENLEIIKNIELSESLLICDKDLNVNNEEFHRMIKNNIISHEEMVEDFLVNGQNIDFSVNSIFEEWYQLCYHKLVIEYLKNKLHELQLFNPYSKTEKQTGNLNNYLSNIWISKIFETMFHQLLIDQNVIDINNKAKEGFKNVSANFFHIVDRLKNRIMKKRVTEAKFAKFLNDKYDAKIIIKRGFKIGNNNHLSDEFNTYVEDFLNEI